MATGLSAGQAFGAVCVGNILVSLHIIIIIILFVSVPCADGHTCHGNGDNRSDHTCSLSRPFARLVRFLVFIRSHHYPRLYGMFLVRT
jgi:hypothetical protein